MPYIHVVILYLLVKTRSSCCYIQKKKKRVHHCTKLAVLVLAKKKFTLNVTCIISVYWWLINCICCKNLILKAKQRRTFFVARWYMFGSRHQISKDSSLYVLEKGNNLCACTLVARILLNFATNWRTGKTFSSNITVEMNDVLHASLLRIHVSLISEEGKTTNFSSSSLSCISLPSKDRVQ